MKGISTCAATNKKFHKATVVYDGRILPRKPKERIEVDVRSFIFNNDLTLKQALNFLNLKKCKNNDEKAFKIATFVRNYMTYVPDQKSVGALEFWQFPFETMALKTGDCEDGAILIASLLVNAGIPSYRVRVVAGLVQTGTHAETGGHAYTIYLREKDNKYCVLDWCYCANNLKVSDRKEWSKEPKYLSWWFMFNNQYSWTPKPTNSAITLSGRLSLGAQLIEKKD